MQTARNGAFAECSFVTKPQDVEDGMHRNPPIGQTGMPPLENAQPCPFPAEARGFLPDPGLESNTTMNNIQLDI